MQDNKLFKIIDLVDVFGVGGSEEWSASLLVLDLNVSFTAEQRLDGSELTVIGSSVQRRLLLVVLSVDERTETVWIALGSRYQLPDDGLDDVCLALVVALDVRDVMQGSSTVLVDGAALGTVLQQFLGSK